MGATCDGCTALLDLHGSHGALTAARLLCRTVDCSSVVGLLVGKHGMKGAADKEPGGRETALSQE